LHEIQDYMKRDHAACDDGFVDVEAAVVAKDWERATATWNRFEQSLRRHFRAEEEVLFPAIELHTGMAAGPTQVMRMDHDQIRALLGPLERALGDLDADEFLGLLHSLIVLIQQHNMKEEHVLYPMADQALPDPSKVVDEMRSCSALDAG